MALKRAFRDPKEKIEDEKPTAKAFLPYVSTISGRISRILNKHNIKTVNLPPNKLRNQLVRAKDPAGLKVPGVYRIPCECGDVYIGETCRTIETRIKEHQRHLRLCQPTKSAVAEHAINLDHAIQWKDTTILGHSKGYWDRLTKEAIEIRLEKKNFNRDEGFHLSRTWNPILKMAGKTKREIDLT
jgi:hypothetical protein